MSTKRNTSCGASFSKDALDHFVENGWMIVPYSGTPVRKRIESLNYRLECYFNQPEEHLKKFTLLIDREGNKDPDDGYVRKAEKDYKKYVQYRSDLLVQLSRFGVVSGKCELQLWKECEKLRKFTLEVELALARALDDHIRGFGFYHALTTPRALELHVLRLLSYDPPKDDRELAGFHFDRSCFTVHLFESHPGLYLGPEGNEIKYAPSDSGILIFAGDKAQVLTGGKIDHDAFIASKGKIKNIEGGIIKRVRHGVRPDKALKGRRLSAVFFGHTEHSLPWK